MIRHYQNIKKINDKAVFKNYRVYSPVKKEPINIKLDLFPGEKIILLSYDLIIKFNGSKLFFKKRQERNILTPWIELTVYNIDVRGVKNDS